MRHVSRTCQASAAALRRAIIARKCGGLVFGGIHGQTNEHTIYAGSLDDPSRFVPRMALFVRDRPAWAEVKAGLTEYWTMPG